MDGAALLFGTLVRTRTRLTSRSFHEHISFDPQSFCECGRCPHLPDQPTRARAAFPPKARQAWLAGAAALSRHALDLLSFAAVDEGLQKFSKQPALALRAALYSPGELEPEDLQLRLLQRLLTAGRSVGLVPDQAVEERLAQLEDRTRERMLSETGDEDANADEGEDDVLMSTSSASSSSWSSPSGLLNQTSNRSISPSSPTAAELRLPRSLAHRIYADHFRNRSTPTRTSNGNPAKHSHPHRFGSSQSAADLRLRLPQVRALLEGARLHAWGPDLAECRAARTLRDTAVALLQRYEELAELVEATTSRIDGTCGASVSCVWFGMLWLKLAKTGE